MPKKGSLCKLDFVRGIISRMQIIVQRLQKTVYNKKHGVDRICFTHHPTSVICSSRNSSDESLQYLSLYDNRCLRYFKGHQNRVTSLYMSPANDSFMSGSLDHTVRLWDLRVNACQRCGFSLEPCSDAIEACFSPDGQYVISGSGDGSLHAWNVNTGNEVACWKNHTGVPTAVKWAPRRVMFASASSVLAFWIPDTSKLTSSDTTLTDAASTV